MTSSQTLPAQCSAVKVKKALRARRFSKVSRVGISFSSRTRNVEEAVIRQEEAKDVTIGREQLERLNSTKK